MRTPVTAIMTITTFGVVAASLNLAAHREAETLAASGVDLPSGGAVDTAPSAGDSTSTDATPEAGGDAGQAPSAPAQPEQPPADPAPGQEPAPTGTQQFTGSAARTHYGPVQVQITVSGGVITESRAIQYPNHSPKDVAINARAIPRLNADAVDKQSANISNVSGATVTSDGYRSSLQSAIDQAGL